jgi:hypothetical protein
MIMRLNMFFSRPRKYSIEAFSDVGFSRVRLIVDYSLQLPLQTSQQDFLLFAIFQEIKKLSISAILDEGKPVNILYYQVIIQANRLGAVEERDIHSCKSRPMPYL